MRVLVTGCAGFIGWKVSEFLLKDGHTVVGVDSLNDAYDVRLKEWRLSQLGIESDFTFHQLDVARRQTMCQVFQENAFDSVVSLAARAGVRQSLEDPWVYYETNVTGTLNLLELCREMGVKKFILASTSSVYGREDRPFREDAPTDRPISPYAASKKAAESLCYVYHHAHGLDATVLRYFTVYGPAGRPDMAVLRFIRWIAEGDPVVLYGDGTQERDFTYVDDIARGTLLALKPLGYEVINLGSDRPVAVNDVIGMVQDLLGKRAYTKRYPVHPADVPATWADITKAKDLLGWAPAVSLEEGLQRAVAWYHENRSWAKEVCG